jgi:hypothetical protein
MTMYAPRPWAKFRALLGGYFWTECPRCGRWFAGYETRGSVPKRGGLPGEGLLTCCPPDQLDWTALIDGDESDWHDCDCGSVGGGWPHPASAHHDGSRDREPQPSDGPDYHADHAAWVQRNDGYRSGS